MANIPFKAVIEKLYNHRVLLVGGGGFIGHNLALGLRRNNITTMVVDNLMVNSLVDNTFHDNGDVSKRSLNLHFLMPRFELMR